MEHDDFARSHTPSVCFFDMIQMVTFLREVSNTENISKKTVTPVLARPHTR